MRRFRAHFALLLALLTTAGACRCDLSARTADGRLMWRDLDNGLSYARLETIGTLFHLVRVPLDKFEIFAADARTDDRLVATVAELRQETRAVAALNGTFFDEKQRPLGLLVSDGKQLNPLRDISWWAAVVVSEHEGKRTVSLKTTQQLKALDEQARSRIRFALQVGPRTVSDGEVVKLKPQSATRSAVCITAPDELILVASEGGPVDANALARLMADAPKEGGLGCNAGLMLDGGPSTQLEVAAADFSVSVTGGWGVPNALAVRPRSEP